MLLRRYLKCLNSLFAPSSWAEPVPVKTGNPGSSVFFLVIPVTTGIQCLYLLWIPAFAGMTEEGNPIPAFQHFFLMPESFNY